MARILIKAHPNARRSAIAGRLGNAYKLDIAAPAAEGKANSECLRFLAELLRVPRSNVHIVQGAASRMKLIQIEDMAQQELEDRIERIATRR